MRYTSKEIPQKCPKCNSNRVVNIVYGYPAPETFREAENGKIALGGCCITDDDPSWLCFECNVEIYKELS